MKKATLLLTMLFHFLCFSQEIDWQNLNTINDPIIINNKETKLLDPVGNTKFAVFKIKDINKFLYKVEIIGKGFDLNTPIPTELQKLFRLSPEEVKAIADNTKATDAANKIKAEGVAMKELATAVTTDKTLSAQLDALSLNCKKFYEKANDLKKKLFDLKTLKIDLINIAQKDVSFATINAFTSVAEDVPDPKKMYSDFLDLYVEVEKRYDEVTVEAKSKNNQEAATKEINTAKTKIEEAYEVLVEENILNLYKELSFLNGELRNNKNFIAQASPVQMTGDFIEYKCKITPSQTNTLGAYKTVTEINFIVPNKGGLKVDFSVGPTLSFGKNAKDEKYFLEPSSNAGKSFLRQRDNTNAGTPGLAAMMHFYIRSGNEISYGGLFGVGAGFQSIKDLDVSFYLGGSAIMGKTQKLMLNAGLSLLRVDRLKEKEFVIDKEYATQDFLITNVVEKVFKPSLFVSLSYNFAKRSDN
jgi:hypothetical protein